MKHDYIKQGAVYINRKEKTIKHKNLTEMIKTS